MEEITKTEIQELMKAGGEVRGVTFIIDRDFVFKNKGEKGLKKVE